MKPGQKPTLRACRGVGVGGDRRKARMFTSIRGRRLKHFMNCNKPRKTDADATYGCPLYTANVQGVAKEMYTQRITLQCQRSRAGDGESYAEDEA